MGEKVTHFQASVSLNIDRRNRELFLPPLQDWEGRERRQLELSPAAKARTYHSTFFLRQRGLQGYGSLGNGLLLQSQLLGWIYTLETLKQFVGFSRIGSIPILTIFDFFLYSLILFSLFFSLNISSPMKSSVISPDEDSQGCSLSQYLGADLVFEKLKQTDTSRSSLSWSISPCGGVWHSKQVSQARSRIRPAKPIQELHNCLKKVLMWTKGTVTKETYLWDEATEDGFTFPTFCAQPC